MTMKKSDVKLDKLTKKLNNIASQNRTMEKRLDKMNEHDTIYVTAKVNN